jgi:hypothetical protein
VLSAHCLLFFPDPHVVLRFVSGNFFSLYQKKETTIFITDAKGTPHHYPMRVKGARLFARASGRNIVKLLENLAL